MFVALGVVFTTSDEPPDPEDLECRTVPIKWVQRAKNTPQLVWEDSGTGGRPGSVWSVSTCNQITLTKGHDAPQEMFYDFRAERFFLRPEDILTEKDAGQIPVSPSCCACLVLRGMLFVLPGHCAQMLPTLCACVLSLSLCVCVLSLCLSAYRPQGTTSPWTATP